MDGRIVDERDTQWEATATAYRVAIHRPNGEIATYEFDSSDLADVLVWSRETAGENPYSVAAVVRGADRGVGVVYLTPPPLG